MKVFKKFNINGDPCPICKTKDEKETTLVTILGTEEGNIAEAKQVHVDCLPDFQYDPIRHMLTAVLGDEELEETKK